MTHVAKAAHQPPKLVVRKRVVAEPAHRHKVEQIIRRPAHSKSRGPSLRAQLLPPPGVEHAETNPGHHHAQILRDILPVALRVGVADLVGSVPAATYELGALVAGQPDRAVVRLPAVDSVSERRGGAGSGGEGQLDLGEE